MTARLPTLADAAAIAWIYNQGIEERIATFDTEPRSTAQIEAQFAEKGDRYPTDRGSSGMATSSPLPGAGPYRTREAYAGGGRALRLHGPACARGGGWARGAGRLGAGEYAARGFWKLVSRIFPENRASL